MFGKNKVANLKESLLFEHFAVKGSLSIVILNFVENYKGLLGLRVRFKSGFRQLVSRSGIFTMGCYVDDVY
jgi:hypothetical protein